MRSLETVVANQLRFENTDLYLTQKGSCTTCMDSNLYAIITENDDWKVLLFLKLPTEPYNTKPIRPEPISQTSEEILMELYRLLEIFVDYCSVNSKNYLLRGPPSRIHTSFCHRST